MTLKLTTYKCKGTETRFRLYTLQIKLGLRWNITGENLKTSEVSNSGLDTKLPQLLKPVLFRGGLGRGTVQSTGASEDQFSKDFNESEIGRGAMTCCRQRLKQSAKYGYLEGIHGNNENWVWRMWAKQKEIFFTSRALAYSLHIWARQESSFHLWGALVGRRNVSLSKDL